MRGSMRRSITSYMGKRRRTKLRALFPLTNARLAVVVFWILVILIGVSNRIYQAFCLSYYRSHRRLDLTKTSPIRGSWLKRNLLLPATFGYTCARSVWWCTIPSRLQTVTIGTFLLINTVYCIIGYRFTRENY